ncbi:NEDD4-binding protein 1 [Megalops cyprinoides]|uniref:NEDD4-binding protein 1 n=1 Tax=Megalops cyprinoides TaxID=118141 RepID=UPI001864404C|nr:NEDD4-binding protein 1 [Megalops cyprinoides]
MSTTRPLLGMKRIPELACAEPPGSRHPAAAGQPQHDALTVDEFTVPEDKQEELRCVKPRVEQVFQVAFTIIGLLDPTAAHGSKASRQIWLKLKGKTGDVSKAKEYVKGLCAPELQQVELYPTDMHCIFVGARGLFLDQLLRDTSAEVAVLEPGRLRLLGGAEAVVMAQSRVQQFVALFQQNRSLPGDSEPAVKRAFKTFVEERADKYTMELLLLPSALKEELLNLARNAAAPPTNAPPTNAAAAPPPEQDRSQTSTPVTDLSNRILDTSFEDKAAGASPEALVLNGRPSHKRRSSESEARDTKRQFSLERRDRDLEEECCCISSDGRQGPPAGEDVVVLDSELSDDADGVSPETNFKCLVNFFRTMGYQQDVVERVVRGAGQRDDTFLLLERIVEESQRAQRAQVLRTPSPSCQPPASSSRAREYPEGKAKENVQPGSNGVVQCSGVQQRAALRGSSSAQSAQDVITIVDDGAEDAAADGKGQAGGRANFSAVAKMDYLSRGSSRAGPERVETLTPLRSSTQRLPLAAERPGCSYQTVSPRVPSVTPPPRAAPLTGVSRFQQSLRTPYRLTLQNEPGEPGLRHIIIDGSNVAMMHGLHRFFSCRGIAIAVETFWKRGHREITVFVPQWRQKRDPNITEQHFLTQLEDLRLLSFTPSREVCGQRISSHDDRFLLHLAEKTDGVIVTNDNMREFVDTSEAWRQIIKERLLQFTFVEDHFLIPDDPLGKHGPQLDEFLRKDFRCTPVPTPARSELRATPPIYVQALQSAPRPSLAPQTRPPSRWPHTGPPGWHPPRPSPSPPPQRSPAETEDLKKKLYDIFPDQKPRIDRILSDNPYMRDLNALSGLLLG